MIPPLSRTLLVSPWTALVVALLLFLGGMWAGNEVPWGTKTPRTLVGKAYLHDGQFASFDSDDGEQLAFAANGVEWRFDAISPEGPRAHCLRRGEPVAVMVSVISFEPPGGGEYRAVVWVQCPM